MLSVQSLEHELPVAVGLGTVLVDVSVTVLPDFAVGRIVVGGIERPGCALPWLRVLLSISPSAPKIKPHIVPRISAERSHVDSLLRAMSTSCVFNGR